MTLIKTLMATVLVASTLSLTACGFTLRGTSQAMQIPASYANVFLSMQDTPELHALKQPLVQELGLIGVSSTQSSDLQIEIKNLRFRRYELVGTLTEIRLVLTADVIFTTKDGRKLNDTAQVEHSYQYNEASVTPQDQQGEQVKPWLYDELAKRITQKYHAFALESKN